MIEKYMTIYIREAKYNAQDFQIPFILKIFISSILALSLIVNE